MALLRSHHFRRFLLLALLANLALAQPLYSLLGEQAEFLVAHRLGSVQLLAVAATLSLALPALIATLPLAVSRLGRMPAREVFYLAFVVLAALAVLPAAKAAGLQGAAAIGSAVLAATALAAAYWRFAAVRLFFAYLSPAILVFPLIFLLWSRAAGIVLSSAPGERDAGTIQPSDHDIVVLVFDEFPLVSLLTPDLEIDRGRYPNFARLADLSHWFPGASSGAEGTVIAVPSALTGIPPAEVKGRLPLLSNFPDNLFTRFRFSHSVEAYETSTRLCPDPVCRKPSDIAARDSLVEDLWLVWLHIVTPAPWSERLPSVSNAWSGFGQAHPYAGSPGLEQALAVADWSRQMDWSQRTQQFHRFVQGIEPGPAPHLYYLHTLLPHAPWNHLPDGRQYAFGETSLARGLFQDSEGVWRWAQHDWLVQQAWQRHLLQVQYLDRLLGELLDRLAAQNLLDDAALVVMGDHGASFIAGEPRREATARTLTDISAVPLFIKAPGQRRGHRHDIDARLQDVMPTLLDALGLPYRGLSLLDEAAGEYRGPIEIYGRVGLAARYSFAEHMTHLRERAQTKASLFGTGGQGGLYAIGSEPALHGLAVPARVAAAPGVEVQFAGRNLYLNVDPAAAFTPRLVRGEVHGLDPGATPAIAIAVNGVVEATTRVYDGAFSALLGPRALRSGLNPLEAYLLPGSGRLAGLIRLRQPGSAVFTLAPDANPPAILPADGAGIPLAAGSAGLVNIVPAEGNSLLYLAGSVDARSGPAAQVLAFLGTSLAGVSAVGEQDRSFSIPVAADAAPPHTPVRVFALLDAPRRAVELAFGEQCNENWAFTPGINVRAHDCTAETETPLARGADGWSAELEFGSAAVAGLLGSGWGNVGPGIRWSMGKSATLNIPLPPDLPGLEFKAYVKPFLAPPELPQQGVWLLANGRPVASWRLGEDRFWPIEWSVGADLLALAPDMLELRFVTPDARAPRALGAGSDLRELALAFTSLEIHSEGSEGQTR